MVIEIYDFETVYTVWLEFIILIIFFFKIIL